MAFVGTRAIVRCSPSEASSICSAKNASTFKHGNSTVGSHILLMNYLEACVKSKGISLSASVGLQQEGKQKPLAQDCSGLILQRLREDIVYNILQFRAPQTTFSDLELNFNPFRLVPFSSYCFFGAGMSCCCISDGRNSI
jgi:hypothetical protein